MKKKSNLSPNIYVIVVTFNMLDGLKKTLDSIVNVAKKYDNLELKTIVINGNPLDTCHLIVAKYSDYILKYIAETDLGIYDAMNKGIVNLPDDGYAIFINSDDEIISIPGLIEHEKHDIIFCDVESHDVSTGLREVFQVYHKKKLNASNLLRPRIHHQGCFVRSSILKKYKFNLSIGIRADVLLMGLVLKNYHFSFQNQTVAVITTGGKSDDYNISNFLSFLSIANLLGINKFATVILSLPEVFKYFLKVAIGKRGVQLVRRFKCLLSQTVETDKR